MADYTPPTPSPKLAELADLKSALKVTGIEQDNGLCRVLSAAGQQFLDDTGRTLADFTPEGSTDPVIPANVANGVIALAIFLHVSAPNIGKVSVGDQVAGQTSFENRFLPLAYTTVVDAYRKWSA